MAIGGRPRPSRARPTSGNDDGNAQALRGSGTPRHAMRFQLPPKRDNALFKEKASR